MKYALHERKSLCNLTKWLANRRPNPVRMFTQLKRATKLVPNLTVLRDLALVDFRMSLPEKSAIFGIMRVMVGMRFLT